ncbi:cell division protein FtsQ/DivIB [Aestuariimicrobium sp. T2.26MG-19.2B]|uniref:cell division protein FtsQ/DivIB n=1 Tax=Aestuariimicrobium sp. T2.26MG-19.2B TaxID=3040679 RepID=UPI0024777871|nr:FtsQ-type POTRA domain-containing protein [Aestuariimicrobium sp. T2.26MG-19.2B]CAI9399428.1 Cell division protein FtsQ [Aestuariimicrobium sp. T2.26MG-19.2B]
MADRSRVPGLADARPGLRRRRRRARWRRVRPVVLAGVGLGLAVVLAVVVWFTPVFSVREVRIEGTRLLTSTQVESRARVPVGQPLAQVRLQQISDRVATLPEVESVSTTRRWPSAVQVVVTERTARVQRINGSTYQWVDGSGVVFHTQTQRDPRLVVVNTTDTDRRLLGDLATVAQSLTPRLRSEVTGMKAQSPDTITVVLRGGRSVVWGSAEESATKAQVATALLQVKATVYDVSSPANPTSR